MTPTCDTTQGPWHMRATPQGSSSLHGLLTGPEHMLGRAGVRPGVRAPPHHSDTKLLPAFWARGASE